MWQSELDLAIKLARQAGEKILNIYKKESLFSVEYKSDNSPLTSADKASNSIIVSGLRQQFANYAILSEEEQDNRQRLKNDYCFVIDPLDGTKEFIKRNGQFTVNIALAYKHRTVMGVIYVPVSGELFYASQGDGAYYQKGKNTTPERIRVSQKKDITHLRIVASSSHGSPQLDAFITKIKPKEILKIGSSLKGCLIANGDADIYYRSNPTMEWDTAAMQCIVEEAGGIFRQMDNSEMLYNREDSTNRIGFFVLANINLLDVVI